EDREALIAGVYEALVDWVIHRANEAIASEVQANQEEYSNLSGNEPGQWSDEDTVSITVVDLPRPALGKAVAMRGVFDDTLGINAEMKEDGVPVSAVGNT